MGASLVGAGRVRRSLVTVFADAAVTGALADVVGSDLQVPVVPSGTRRLIHLDHAASAPPLRAVADRVAAFLPWYASVHRGAGFASTVSGDALDAARRRVGGFVGARRDDVVVWTRNTTDALNLLAGTLPDDTTVVTLDLEHHANLLPWRRHAVVHAPTPPRAGDVPDVIDAALAAVRTRHALVAMTGASNVTGEVLPVADVVAVAHRRGARVVLDAAQLAAHHRVDIERDGVDWVAFSGHKLYAPYGAGALIGRADWLDRRPGYLAGGGAVRNVTIGGVDWLSTPARHEGGTPNVLGALAIDAACAELEAIGLDAVARHDGALIGHLLDGLAALEHDVRPLSVFGTPGEAGIVALAFDRPTDLIAAALSAEHAIATRDGAFCAHPLMRRLGGAPDEAPAPSALRVSVGVGTTHDDVDTFVDALDELLRRGPRACYAAVAGRLAPDPDPRARPF